MLASASHWESLHSDARFRPAYPSEHVVRFLVGCRSSLATNLPRRFLDIGTGAGRHMALAADLGFFPVGVDVSWNGLCHAHQRLSPRGTPHMLVTGEMTDLPFDENSFSAIVSYGVFCYGDAANMNMAISEALRVLCPGGRLFVVLRSTRDHRYGKGKQVEPNTFLLDITETNEGGMVQHFLAADDIPIYFDRFAKVTLDSSEITFANRSRLDSDWLITAEK